MKQKKNFPEITFLLFEDNAKSNNEWVIESGFYTVNVLFEV